MFKKKIPWMLLFLVLMVLSIWAVVSHSGSYSLQLLKDTLKNAKVGWLIAACVGMLLNIFCEGWALDVLVHALTRSDDGPKIRSHGFLYSAADIYFSAITPSASGGQPASAFFMSRDNIPVAHTAVILVANMFLYTISLVVIGLIGFFICPSIFWNMDTLAKILVTLGFVFLLGLSVLFVLILKKEKWVKNIAVMFISLGSKLRIIRHKQSLLDRVDRSIQQYKACAGLVNEKKLDMLKAFGFNFLQRLSLLSTTILVYLAFGGSFEHLPMVISVSALVLVGVYSLPVPGGMGVADYLLINGLTMVPDIESAANLELVSRGISFYSCIALSLIVVIIGYFIQTKRLKARGELVDEVEGVEETDGAERAEETEGDKEAECAKEATVDGAGASDSVSSSDSVDTSDSAGTSGTTVTSDAASANDDDPDHKDSDSNSGAAASKDESDSASY